ncbi:MAG TPA: aminopeptidase, partial [Propionicimonas sp.]|nr:aminopeptidase [Propionicimonas sp.]HRA07181.1 aminopeptidase [Propionicimonas sp.]
DVPVAASVYHGDAFVPVQFSLETAALLPDCRTWVTSEYEHNGLRADPAVLDHLIGLLKNRRWL